MAVGFPRARGRVAGCLTARCEGSEMAQHAGESWTMLMLLICLRLAAVAFVYALLYLPKGSERSNSALLTDTKPHSIKWTPQANARGGSARGVQMAAPVGPKKVKRYSDEFKIQGGKALASSEDPDADVAPQAGGECCPLELARSAALAGSGSREAGAQAPGGA